MVKAQGYLFDKASSEDVVQDVFLQIWENADSIHIKTNLRVYLCTMVRNRCLNRLKALKITDHSKFLERNEYLIADVPREPFPDKDRAMVYNRVLQIVDAMPMGMQQIFKMKFVNNYKYIEIADELGISVNTVKTQLKRAKSRIGELSAFLLFLLSLLQ